MTKNALRYTYNTTVTEWYDVTPCEMIDCVREEMKKARKQNYNLIITGKSHDKEGFFNATTAEKLTCDFMWLHICPQDILNFDEEEGDEKKFYILSFIACAEDGLHLEI